MKRGEGGVESWPAGTGTTDAVVDVEIVTAYSRGQ